MRMIIVLRQRRPRCRTSNPTGHRLTYGFDAAGNRAWMDAPHGRTTYQYDAANACVLLHNPYEERTTLQWDALGREKHKTLGNGMTVSHAYDPAGREVGLENRLPTGEGIGVYTAQYDPVGNRLTSEELDGSRVTYGYDPSYQLTSEVRSGTWPYDRGYQYDGVGNRLLKTDGAARTTYQYNLAQELVRTDLPDGSITTSAWDANGNLATEVTGAAITSYAWDSENQARQIIAPPNVISSYRYRADHHRGYQENDTSTRHLLWDGVNCLLELDSGLVLLAEYTGLPGEWGGLASLRRGATSGFYGFDLQWTARQLLSAGAGVTDAYWQDAFGSELFASGSTVNPYRYVGAYGYRREDATRDDVWHRLLRRDLGRWVGRDPLETLARYGYCAERPLASVDPSGLLPRWIVIGGPGAIGVAFLATWAWRRCGCRALRPATQAWLDSICASCARTAQGMHLGGFWTHVCTVAKTAIACPKRLFPDPEQTASSEYGVFLDLGQKLLVPYDFQARWKDPCRTLFHESIHLHCGIHSTVGDLDNEDKGGSVYKWTDFVLDQAACPARSQAILAGWHGGRPQAKLCHEVKRNRGPEHTFIIDARGCVTGVR